MAEEFQVPPMLVGLAVDVSGSMGEAIDNPAGPGGNRLQAVRESVRDLARRGRDLVEDGQDAESAVRVFAYGFGFGNPISVILGRGGAPVRELLALPGENGLVSVVDLANRWDVYEDHLTKLARHMLGSTPMLEGLRRARDRFIAELPAKEYRLPPVLFLLSDGVPDSGTAPEVRQLAHQLKADGILIVSCYVTASDAIESRHLAARPHPSWPEGALLMFECASPIEDGSPLAAYLADQGWRIDQGGRLFAQINQSDILREFMAATISPAAHDPVRVFISYAHEDEELRQRLESHLASLRRQAAIDVWTDRQIVAGQQWAEEIDDRIELAEMVLLLVSADFLASDYCYGKEMVRALERHSEGTTTVIPIMLKPVDWEGAPFRHVAALPTDARPLTSWPTLDEGLANVAKGIRAAVARIRQQ